MRETPEGRPCGRPRKGPPQAYNVALQNIYKSNGCTTVGPRRLCSSPTDFTFLMVFRPTVGQKRSVTVEAKCSTVALQTVFLRTALGVYRNFPKLFVIVAALAGNPGDPCPATGRMGLQLVPGKPVPNPESPQPEAPGAHLPAPRVRRCRYIGIGNSPGWPGRVARTPPPLRGRSSHRRCMMEGAGGR